MSSVLLRLIFFVSFASLNCRAAINENDPTNLLPPISLGGTLSKFEEIDTLSVPYHDNVADQPSSNLKTFLVRRTKEEDIQRERLIVLKAASNVIHSKSIGEMIKRFKKFSQTLDKGILKEKALRPLNRKFERSYEDIQAQGKLVFDMAEKLEKQGENKSKKQLDTFKTMMKSFTKRVDKFTKAVQLESKKQRIKSLKIMKKNPNDIGLITNAKRCLNLADLVSETIRVIGSIPSKIGCLIFGNCDDNGESTDNDGDESGNDDEEEDEEDDDESEDDDSENDD